MDKKLSIVQRSTDKTCWDKSDNFTSSDIGNIKITNVKHDKSLNAIPSPLARMHLFEAAFDLLDKDESNQTNYAGDAFKKHVSDCFDVFELIYNWNNHLKNGKDLIIIKWSSETEINKLKNNNNSKHKLLGDTLEVFLNDNSFANSKEFLIIKLGNKVIAGSSPFTGFFTAADNLNNLGLYNPVEKGDYFTKIIPFKDRNKRIQKYIFDFFENQNLVSTASTVRNYLERYRGKLKLPTELNLEDLNSANNSLFGEQLQSGVERNELNYFHKHLIKLNYRINEECFYLPQINKEERDYDFLLPLTDDFFKDFSEEDISTKVKIKIADDSSVEVSIEDGENTFKKKYHKTQINDNVHNGKLIDLNNDYKIKLNLGIFPFLKVTDENTPYNDMYKVMFVNQDKNYNYKSEDYNVSFKIKNDWVGPPSDGNYVISKSYRTIAERVRATTGSTYYTIKGKNNKDVNFELIKISFPFKDAIGIIAPKWREKKIGKNKIDYCIDFGTTTTFMAYSEGENINPKPFSLTSEENEIHYPLALLNKPRTKNDELHWIQCFEGSLNDFLESIEIQKQEFIPSIIDEDKYSFPFRSVIYKKNNVPFQNVKLFENANIGFLYQKQENYATAYDQNYESNLKWNINIDNDYKSFIATFIEELLYLIRFKTIMLSGSPLNTKISWFSPLSFTPAVLKDYSDLWNEKFNMVFKSDNGNIRNITESEAPYYYFSKAAKIDNQGNILTIDIGGGTTDVMLTKGNSPVLCTSFHFGANVIWGNGYNEFIYSKDNGIYQEYLKDITEILNKTELKSLNDDATKSDSRHGSDEIINFWIYNNDKSKILDFLKKNKFKLSYLLHLSSIIYNLLKLIKSKHKEAPACIIFSGNGSKYIDLIQSPDYIKRICGFFIKKIFNSSSDAPQIILQEKNRKEATCFGGLYIPFNNEISYEKINYLGIESGNITIKKYSDIENNKEELLYKIQDNFNEFINTFFSMNDDPDLSFKTHFGIDCDLALMKEYLIQKCRENLELGYSKRMKIAKPEDDITDSLFFYPLIGLIFKINNLSEEDLKKSVVKKKVKFAISYDIENGFSNERLFEQKKYDSVFIISYDADIPETAELEIINDESVYKTALGSIDGYLRPVCEWEEYPTKDTTSFKVIENGILEKGSNGWNIKKKMKIKFV